MPLYEARQIDIEGSIRETYAKITKGPLHDQAREIVSPYIQSNQEEIDWLSLSRDTEAVAQLKAMRKWQEEEEAIMLLLLH